MRERTPSSCLTGSPPFATLIRSWFSIGADRRAGHARAAGSGAAASTPSSIRSNCSKRSWRPRERSSRRRGAGQGLRCAPHAPARCSTSGRTGATWRLALAAIFIASVAELAQPYLFKVAIDRFISTSQTAGLRGIAGALSAHARRLVRGRIRTDVDGAVDRPAHHVRPAHGDLRPPPAPGRAVLRSQSGRPTDDAGDLRRRRAQRSLHLRRDHGVRRCVHADGDHGNAAVDELAAGARHVRGAAAHRARDPMVPPERARFVPGRARVDCADQRVSAGKHHRDDDRPAVPARSAQFRAVRRNRPAAPRRQHPVDLLLRGVLSRDRSAWRRSPRRSSSGTAAPAFSQHADARRARGVPSVCAAVLPADQRHVGEVQRAAGRHGLVRAHLQAARRAGGRLQPPDACARSAGGRAYRVRRRLVRLQRDHEGHEDNDQGHEDDD